MRVANYRDPRSTSSRRHNSGPFVGSHHGYSPATASIGRSRRHHHLSVMRPRSMRRSYRRRSSRDRGTRWSAPISWPTGVPQEAVPLPASDLAGGTGSPAVYYREEASASPCLRKSRLTLRRNHRAAMRRAALLRSPEKWHIGGLRAVTRVVQKFRWFYFWIASNERSRYISRAKKSVIKSTVNGTEKRDKSSACVNVHEALKAYHDVRTYAEISSLHVEREEREIFMALNKRMNLLLSTWKFAYFGSSILGKYSGSFIRDNNYWSDVTVIEKS